MNTNVMKTFVTCDTDGYVKAVVKFPYLPAVDTQNMEIIVGIRNDQNELIFDPKACSFSLNVKDDGSTEQGLVKLAWDTAAHCVTAKFSGQLLPEGPVTTDLMLLYKNRLIRRQSLTLRH